MVLQCTGEFHSNDLGRNHKERLPQHHGLGLDAAHPPAQDPKTVYHCGVRISAHDRFRQKHAAVLVRPAQDALAEVLEVHLMDNAVCGRHDPQIIEGLCPPAQKFITFLVAEKFLLHVLSQGILRTEVVHLNRVVNDQINRHQGIDDLRVTAKGLHCITHGRKIHHTRHAGEVLHDHPGRQERKFMLSRRCRIPPGKTRHILSNYKIFIAVSQQGFEHNPDGKG